MSPASVSSSDRSRLRMNVYYKATPSNGPPRKPRTNCRSIARPALFPEPEEKALAEISSPPPSTHANAAPAPTLLTLPLELRLDIYSHLLPAQTHTIITQAPYSGVYCAAVPAHSTQSYYAPLFLRPAPPNLTTYAAPRRRIPLHPAILRVCRQIHAEAAPVLYAAKGVAFDFDTHLDAVAPFVRDRGASARDAMARIRVALDVPRPLPADAAAGPIDLGATWTEVCRCLRGMAGLKWVEVVAWGPFGRIEAESVDVGAARDAAPLPISSAAVEGPDAAAAPLAADGRPRAGRDAEMRARAWVAEVVGTEDELGDVEIHWCDGSA